MKSVPVAENGGKDGGEIDSVACISPFLFEQGPLGLQKDPRKYTKDFSLKSTNVDPHKNQHFFFFRRGNPK